MDGTSDMVLGMGTSISDQAIVVSTEEGIAATGVTM
jgi:hypothetical protein